MYVKISAPDKTVYEGSIEKITIPTEVGEITILPNHQPLTSVVKPGLVSLVPNDMPTEHQYVVDNGHFVFSVSRGIVFVDGTNVIITTSAATISPEESAEVLLKMQQDMEATLEKIKVEGSVDELEKAMINLQKVNADLRLVKLKHLH